MRQYLRCLLMLSFLPLFGQSDPTNQAENHWVFQYRKAIMGDVTHPYECGFTWDSKNDRGLVFGGHLGTYTGQIEDEMVNIMNTNMTYGFSFQDFTFHKYQPALRPPKRCGGKTAFDDDWGRLLVIGGGYHNFENEYQEPGLVLNKLTAEGAESATLPRCLAPWAFDAATGQWMAMRPLYLTSPPGFSPHGGYGSNYAFAREYGLMILAPLSTGRVYAYSAYNNQWSWLPENSSDSARPLQESDICVAYDLKHKKLLWFNGNSSNTTEPLKTWSFDVGTRSWKLLPLSTSPTRSTPSWFNAYGAMTYDERNGVAV